MMEKTRLEELRFMIAMKEACDQFNKGKEEELYFLHLPKHLVDGLITEYSTHPDIVEVSYTILPHYRETDLVGVSIRPEIYMDNGMAECWTSGHPILIELSDPEKGVRKLREFA